MKPIVRKTFQSEGKWIENPHKTVVVICSCGSKYIKTRDGQTLCLRCTETARAEAAAL